MNHSFRYAFCSLITLVVVLLAQFGGAQAADKKPGRGERARAKVAARLPAHFGDVATDEQRGKLQAIHQDFAEKIEKAQKAAKKAQQEAREAQQAVQELREEEHKKLEAELTAEQREKLASLRAAAKERQAARKAHPKGGRKAAQDKPSASS